MTRIGVIGLGVIGRAVAEYASTRPEHELAFARNRSLGDRAWAAGLDLTVQVGPPTDDELDRTDLVVEAAHPDVVIDEGERVLRRCHLLVVSAGALADPAVLARLTDAAIAHGTNVIVPQGALVGVQGMLAQGKPWTRAHITMVKAPENLDPAPQGLTEATVLYEGSVGPLAKQYPRNVNAMVAFALATLGTRDTVATLVCDPDTVLGHLDVELEAEDGSRLAVRKAQPMQGVSGNEMTASILQSVAAVAGVTTPGLRFV